MTVLCKACFYETAALNIIVHIKAAFYKACFNLLPVNIEAEINSRF